MTKYEEMLRNVEPRENMIPLLQEQGYLTKEALIYEKTYVRDPITGEKRVTCKCTCTACKNKFYETYVSGCACSRGYSVPHGVMIGSEIMSSGQEAICPLCGGRVELKYHGHIHRDGTWLEGGRIQELRVIEGLPVLLKWKCFKMVCKNGETTKEANLAMAYIFEEKKCVRVTAEGYYMGWQYIKDGLHETKRCVDDFGAITHMMPVQPGLLNGTSLENSKLEEYLQCGGNLYPVSYLRLYQRRPKVETLLTSGAGEFLAEMIETEWKSHAGYSNQCCQRIPKLEELNWKAERPSAMLGLNRGELRRAIREEWSVDNLKAYKIIRDQLGQRVGIEDLKDISVSLVDKIVHLGLPVLRTARYLRKQGKNVPYLKDYLDMAKKIGYDIKDPAVIFPKNLEVAHDRVMMLQKQREEKTLWQGFCAQKELLAQLCWEHEGILIRPVEDQKELIAEGKSLNHCVGTYAKRHAEGECSILLIRKAEEPDKPWYTLNFNIKSGKVTENRGNRNCARTPEVAAFEAAWLKAKEKEIRKLQRAAKKRKEKVA